MGSSISILRDSCGRNCERIDGFIENERYGSRRTEGRLLSLSIWADEKSVIRWRTHAMHHGVQKKGRFEVFEDYHLRVGEITADTDIPPGRTLAQKRFDTTEVGAAKAVSIAEVPMRLTPPESLCVRTAATACSMRSCSKASPPGQVAVSGLLARCGAADAWQPPASLPDAGRIRHRRVRVIRDYGLADRREAPQFYPDVAADRRFAAEVAVHFLATTCPPRETRP